MSGENQPTKSIDDERADDVKAVMDSFRAQANALIEKYGEPVGPALVMAALTSMSAEWLAVLRVVPRVYFDRVSVCFQSLLIELLAPKPKT